MNIQNEKQENIVENIYGVLRKRILNEEYLPEEKLSEVVLSNEFSCSRTPVRESLKRLEQDGLIVIQPKSGSYVKMYSPIDNRNLMEVRSYIEGLAVRLIIEHRCDVSRLREIFETMEDICHSSPVDFIAFGEKHYDFHHTLVELSNNELCVQVFERLNLRSSMLFYQSMNERTSRRTQIEHQKIVTMLEEGNPECEKFTIGHLWKKRNSFTRG